jgi:hypothetical protein
MMKLKRTACMALVLIATTACQSAPRPQAQNTTFNPTPYDKQMVQVLDSISLSLRVLAETDSAQARRNLSTSERSQAYKEAQAMPYGLDVQMTLDDRYYPIENALALISEQTGYRLLPIVGVAPKQGLNVRLSGKRTAYDVLRDIGAQAGNRAEVRVITAKGGQRSGSLSLIYAGGR